MSVAIYVTDAKEAASLVPWGANFARASHEDLIVVTPKRSKGKVAWNELSVDDDTGNGYYKEIFDQVRNLNREHFVLKQDIAKGRESSNLDRIAISVLELQSPDPEQTFAEGIAEHGVTMLLVQADEPSRSNKGDSSRVRQLFEQIPCETILLRGVCPDSAQPLRIMIATQGDSDLEVPLKRSRQLAKATGGTVTVLFVQPNDDEVAMDVAARNLKRLLKFDTDHDDLFERQIELADSLIEGVKRQNLDDYDLVIVGSNKPKARRLLFRELEDSPDSNFTTAVAVFRKSVPLANRMWSHFQAVIRNIVPQMEREQRIELFDLLRSESHFNFDFVAMISLSTIIAGLGLIDNSAAVVIGAMLVAPLMTPLLGTGLALVQGNAKLIRNAMRSVLLGFAIAFAIGVVLGLVIPEIAPNGQVNAELSSRCAPNLLHLIVALVSGIAGAYANGRSKPSGAVAGVAIAAALVPPIATSGITFALGEMVLAGGALLLFFTNIVAIILGTALTFWTMGINPAVAGNSDKKLPGWSYLLFFGFVLVSFALAIFLPPTHVLVDGDSFGTDAPPAQTAPENPGETEEGSQVETDALDESRDGGGTD